MQMVLVVTRVNIVHYQFDNIFHGQLMIHIAHHRGLGSEDVDALDHFDEGLGFLNSHMIYNSIFHISSNFNKNNYPYLLTIVPQ